VTAIGMSIRVTSDELADIRAVLSLAFADAAERVHGGELAAASHDAAQYLELLQVVGTTRDPDPSFWMYDEDPRVSREQLAPLARFAIADRAVCVETIELWARDPAEGRQAADSLIVVRERVALFDRFLAILERQTPPPG
jgi:hypothetical protein